MKISISYPPIINKLGQKAMVSQNRNVQYFSKPTYLLPVIHAQAATLLKNNGYEVIWDDGNSENINYTQWYERFKIIHPDIVVFESTTPVMKFYWNLIDSIKNDFPNIIVIMTLSFNEKPN